jgi:prolyl 4-hydroxylase
MNPSDLRHYIRTYDDGLDTAFCRRMIDSFTALPHFQIRNGRGVREGLEQSAWTELNVSKYSDPAFMRLFRARVTAALERYNHDVGLGIPLPNSGIIGNLVMKRYQPGGDERFQVHFDALNQHANRYLVLLWYLNDVEDGGETQFPQLDVSVPARAGRLLMFPPYWMYQHEGAIPRSGDKFILSTYLLFNNAPVGPAAADTHAS